MPLKRDEKGGGTNADGKFTFPDLTVDQMQVRVKEKLREFGFPGFIAGMFTSKIPKLKRWSENQ